VEYQLRIYTVRAGGMEEWVEEWHRHVLPLLRKFGFEVIGPWVIEGEDRFVWILGYEGEDWAAADAAYHESKERRSIVPDPARHLARVESWMMRSP
jgi:hypothetical protein